MFYKNVELPQKLLRDDFVYPAITQKFDSTTYSVFRLSVNDLSRDFVTWLIRRGLRPFHWSSILLFYAPPNSATSVHTDIGPQTFWALNSVLSDTQKITVKWHDCQLGEMKSNDVDYLIHSPDSPIISMADIKNAICKIGFPHSSSNNSNEPMWLLSCRFAPRDIQWDELCTRLS